MLAGFDPANGVSYDDLPLLEDKVMQGNRPTAYVCHSYVCQQPVTDAGALAEQLAAPDGPGGALGPARPRPRHAPAGVGRHWPRARLGGTGTKHSQRWYTVGRGEEAMGKRAVPTAAVLGSLLLLLAACDTGEPSESTPQLEYITGEIPPCEPAAGSKVDPCESGVSFPSSGGGLEFIDSEPWDLQYFLGGSAGQSSVHVAHLVLRGTFLPGTVRCADQGVRFRPPPYSVMGELPYRSINCYADVRVNAYVLGSGPSTLTLLVDYSYFSFEEEEKDVKERRDSTERALLESGVDDFIRVPEGGIEGREMMLFIGPSVDASTEAWQVFDNWDVQQREDDTAIAVHPHRDFWSTEDSYLTYLSQLEMELPAFTQAVATANQARITEYGGRTSAHERYPMLVTDANRLSQFFTDMGAYNHPDGPPVQPPPACGLAVSNQVDNPGLVRDCITLLAGKDALSGTGSLNWGTGIAIGSWDGVTTSSDPSGDTKLLLLDEDLNGTIPPELGDLFELTHLDLSSNSLTGEIPRELGGLSNLVSIKLSGNSLTGCIPIALEGVATNDLSSLNLLYCPPAPDAPTAGTVTETSVPLSWSAVSNAGTYRAEYRETLASDLVWTVDDDTLTGTTHTVDGLYCKTVYSFRVSAYGNGTTYAAAWSDPSDDVDTKTGTCVYPKFGATSYSLSVMEDAAVDAVVGRVMATDPSGGPITYEMWAGNDDGLFAVGERSGEITVAADLTGEAGTTVELTVAAWSERRGGWKATVEVSITE